MIIDIGSGHKPHRNADILLEHRLMGDEHRWDKKLRVDRPTVIYDGQMMPFKNKSFGFSICRHVVEHVKSPRKFLSEIERISSAGYIETPSEIAELVFTPYGQHKWIIYSNRKTLFIKRKLQDNISKTGKLFDYLCDTEKGFETFFYTKRRSLFFVEYFWKEKINSRIIGNSRNTFHDLCNPKTLRQLTGLNKAGYEPKIGRMARVKDQTTIYKFLEMHLITPCCSANAVYQVNHFFCTRCSYRYPIKGKKIDMYVR